MLIFRMVGPDGEGVYSGRGYNLMHNLIGSVTGCRHPSPYDDSGISDFWYSASTNHRREYFFGFESLKFLKDWFNGETGVKNMLDNGFRIEVWETTDYYLGTHQAIFNRSVSQCIDYCLAREKVLTQTAV